MGNVVGGKVYTSSSEFTQMRVALKKKKRTSPSLDLWRFLSESLVCPWQSHQKRVSPLMPLPLSAAVWLLAPSFPFSIQCLCICMIASVETAKWKLWRESTRLRPNPLGSLLDNISQVYPPFFPVPMNTMCLYRCLNMLMIGHGGLRPLLQSFASTKMLWNSPTTPVNCFWTCLGAGGLLLCRWFVQFENHPDLWVSVFWDFQNKGLVCSL